MSSIIIMSSGQKRGTCGHVMALFDSHKKCARCREKGVGDDPCVKKLECQICKGFTPAQVQQLATPTYKSRKERGEQKMTETTSSATPTLVDPSDVSLLGRVHTDKPSSVESTPKKKRVLIALLNPARGNTAVNPLVRTSKVWMTSGVRGFHDLMLCFLVSRLLCR